MKGIPRLQPWGGCQNLFDGITVTPTDDIMRPTLGGTYQHWEDGGYRTYDVSGLKFTLYVDAQGVSVNSYDDGE